MTEETRPSAPQSPETGADTPENGPPPAAPSPAGTASERHPIDVRALQRCPYLAGRPPYGTYHLWPSGANVCYARAAGAKPYGHVSKETQDRCCFTAAPVYERCPDYEQARAREIAPPVFSGAAPQGRTEAEKPLLRRQKVRRQRRSPLQRWWAQNGRMALIGACWLILAIVAFWAAIRSM